MQENEATPAREVIQAAKPPSTWHKVANPSAPVNPVRPPQGEHKAVKNVPETRSCSQQRLYIPSGAVVLPGRLPLHAPRKQLPATEAGNPGCPTRAPLPDERQVLGLIASASKRLPARSFVQASHAKGKRKFIPPRARLGTEL